MKVNKKEIEDLIGNYDTIDKDQQNSAVLIEKDAIMFRLLLIVFVLMVIFFTRSIIRRNNEIYGIVNLDPRGDRLIYLISVVLLLFSLNIFKSNFGFFLMCVFVMIGVFIVSGIFQ